MHTSLFYPPADIYAVCVGKHEMVIDEDRLLLLSLNTKVPKPISKTKYITDELNTFVSLQVSSMEEDLLMIRVLF